MAFSCEVDDGVNVADLDYVLKIVGMVFSWKLIEERIRYVNALKVNAIVFAPFFLLFELELCCICLIVSYDDLPARAQLLPKLQCIEPDEA